MPSFEDYKKEAIILKPGDRIEIPKTDQIPIGCLGALHDSQYHSLIIGNDWGSELKSYNYAYPDTIIVNIELCQCNLTEEQSLKKMPAKLLFLDVTKFEAKIDEHLPTEIQHLSFNKELNEWELALYTGGDVNTIIKIKCESAQIKID